MKMPWRGVLLCSSLLAAAPSSATRAAQWWEGAWAKEPSWCSEPQGDMRPMHLTLEALDLGESVCRVSNIQTRGHVVHIRASCADHGADEVLEYQFELSPLRNGLLLRTTDAEWRLKACR